MIIALSGPSGIGKGFFKESITSEYPQAREIVWYTTRGLRPNEKNRKSVSESEFVDLVSANKLVLVQDMFDHKYGVRQKDLLTESGIWLTEVHPFVISEAKRINPNIVTIGMITNDVELLRERLSEKRKTESVEEINKRVQSAIAEINAIKNNFVMYNEVITVSRDNEGQIQNVAREIFKKYWKECD